MKNIIFSRRNLDFNFVNLELFSAISELPGSFRTRLHIVLLREALFTFESAKLGDVRPSVGASGKQLIFAKGTTS